MAAHNNIKIGDIYYRLKVIDLPFKKNNHWYVKCQCNCNNKTIKDIRVDSLVVGKIKSCGCLAVENGKTQGKKSHKVNKYDLSGEYGIGYTSNYNRHKENWFYFDLEDYDKIKNYCWCFDKDGYLMSMSTKKNIKMHRLIMDCPDDKEVDHIYYDNNNKDSKNDNRKTNLKVCTHKENCQNRVNKNTGIIQTKTGFKVYKNGNYLGMFDTYDKALKIKVGA